MELKFQIWMPAVLCGVPALVLLLLYGGIDVMIVALLTPCFLLAGVSQHKMLQRLERLEALHHAELRERIATTRELQA